MRSQRSRQKSPVIAPCACDEDPKARCEECVRRSYHEWSWVDSPAHGRVVVSNENRNVTFNPGFSVGTAAIRGNEPLRKGWHHYWEIEMSSEVYGTDMMIGVGTEQINLDGHSHSFVSLIGIDEHGWGLSYSGKISHNGKVTNYTEPFGQHAVIGVHLDLFSGSLEFYLNRKPLGVAFSNNGGQGPMNLQNKTLYPVLSSTAARSGMNLLCSRSFPPTLQLRCLLTLGKNIFEASSTSLDSCDLELPPGIGRMIKNNYWWIVTTKTSKPKKKPLQKLNAAVADREPVALRTRSSSKKRSRSELDDYSSDSRDGDVETADADNTRVLRSGIRYTEGPSTPVRVFKGPSKTKKFYSPLNES